MVLSLDSPGTLHELAHYYGREERVGVFATQLHGFLRPLWGLSYKFLAPRLFKND